jgi:ribosomal protein S6
MRYYETLFIVTPEIAEEEVTPVIEKFSGILTDHGASHGQDRQLGAPPPGL